MSLQMLTGVTGGRGQEAWKKHTYELKPLVLFSWSYVCLCFQKLNNTKVILHLITMVDQHPEFYPQQCFNYTLKPKAQANRNRKKKKGMWANFLSRKLLQCALRQIFRRLTFYDVKCSQGWTDIAKQAGRFPRCWAIRYFLKGGDQGCYLPSLIRVQIIKSSEEFLKKKNNPDFHSHFCPRASGIAKETQKSHKTSRMKATL